MPSGIFPEGIFSNVRIGLLREADKHIFEL